MAWASVEYLFLARQDVVRSGAGAETSGMWALLGGEVAEGGDAPGDGDEHGQADESDDHRLYAAHNWQCGPHVISGACGLP
jgi:hypothetical protein